MFVNVPLNGIQDGQFRQAYANVSGGTRTYTDFQWSGQFSGSGEPGPQRPGQIINGFVSEAGDDWLQVEVWDDNGGYGTHTATDLQIDASYPYNEDCEA